MLNRKPQPGLRALVRDGRGGRGCDGQWDFRLLRKVRGEVLDQPIVDGVRAVRGGGRRQDVREALADGEEGDRRGRRADVDEELRAVGVDAGGVVAFVVEQPGGVRGGRGGGGGFFEELEDGDAGGFGGGLDGGALGGGGGGGDGEDGGFDFFAEEGLGGGEEGLEEGRRYVRGCKDARRLCRLRARGRRGGVGCRFQRGWCGFEHFDFVRWGVGEGGVLDDRCGGQVARRGGDFREFEPEEVAEVDNRVGGVFYELRFGLVPDVRLLAVVRDGASDLALTVLVGDTFSVSILLFFNQSNLRKGMM